MPTVNSPDISFLDVKVTLDISGVNPVINLVNQSVGSNLAGLVWSLNVLSPTTTPIYQSSFDSPFKTGIWTTSSITNAWPRPFGRIEFSGNYVLQFEVRDSVGNVFNLIKEAELKAPVGNIAKKSTDPYGQIDLRIQVMCERAALYFVDATSKMYQGITGTSISSYLAVDYPRDPTGALPPPFTITSFNNDALVPFSFNGEGYRASYYSIYEYDLGDNVFARIRYVAQKSFDIKCNIDLCPLYCEVDKLMSDIQTGNCENVQEAKNKLALITPKLAVIALLKDRPDCGVDLTKLIDEVKEIGGFVCDCSSATTGIGQQSALVDGVAFNAISEGGDILGRFENTGNNIVLYLKDKSYQFSICDDSQSSAFDIRTSTSGITTSVCFFVDKAILAEELLNAIKGDVNLVNLFNSIVDPNSEGFLIALDGKCVLETTPLTNYTWTFTNVPGSPLSANLVSLSVNGINKVFSFAFNTTNLTSLQTYLNGKGIGTFTVVSAPSGQITITSNNNPNTIANLVYNVGSGNVVAVQTNIATSVGLVTPSEIVQAIVNYLCGLTDLEIGLSQPFTVPSIGAGVKTNTIVTPVPNATGEVQVLTDLINVFIAAQNGVVDYVLSWKGSDCDGMKSIFADNTKPINASAAIYGNIDGTCAQLNPLSLLQYQLSNMDATTRELFCSAVVSCGEGLACEPYDSFYVEVTPYDTTCSAIVGIEGVFA
jgi:hypothetical protein